MTAAGEAPSSPVYTDRSTGLIAFGVLEIVIGAAVMAIGIPVSFLAVALARASGQALAVRLGPAVVWVWIFGFAALDALFIWLGIGSILCRRWARALALAFSWIWLAWGIPAVTGLLVIGTRGYAGLPRGPSMPEPYASWLGVMVHVVNVVLYVLLPMAAVLFYSRPSTEMTCIFRDPRTRWTDRCPQSVLPLVLVLRLAVLWAGVSIVSAGCIVAFGTTFTGLPGLAILAAVGLLSWALAWGAYRLRSWAWWGALTGALLWHASSLLSRSAGLQKLQGKAGLSQAESVWVQSSRIHTAAIAATALSVAIAIAYLLFVRRRFFVSGLKAGV